MVSALASSTITQEAGIRSLSWSVTCRAVFLGSCVQYSSLFQLSAVVDGVYSEHSHTAGTFAMLSSSRVYVGGSLNTHALPGSKIHSNFVGCLRKLQEFSPDVFRNRDGRGAPLRRGNLHERFEGPTLHSDANEQGDLFHDLMNMAPVHRRVEKERVHPSKSLARKSSLVSIYPNSYVGGVSRAGLDVRRARVRLGSPGPSVELGSPLARYWHVVGGVSRAVLDVRRARVRLGPSVELGSPLARYWLVVGGVSRAGLGVRRARVRLGSPGPSVELGSPLARYWLVVGGVSRAGLGVRRARVRLGPSVELAIDSYVRGELEWGEGYAPYPTLQTVICSVRRTVLASLSKSFMSPEFLTKFLEKYGQLPALCQAHGADYSNGRNCDEVCDTLALFTSERFIEADLGGVEFTADTLKLNLIELGRAGSKLIAVAGHVDFMCQEVEAADPVTFTTRDSNLIREPVVRRFTSLAIPTTRGVLYSCLWMWNGARATTGSSSDEPQAFDVSSIYRKFTGTPEPYQANAHLSVP
uniref:Uncharacterized protein n=1 Tax=Timema bartmani TaxID=61472 RepID=A0A7R9I3U7_9NEOP|nr:unnamed protein product [Timema bartmani]